MQLRWVSVRCVAEKYQLDAYMQDKHEEEAHQRESRWFLPTHCVSHPPAFSSRSHDHTTIPLCRAAERSRNRTTKQDQESVTEESEVLLLGQHDLQDCMLYLCL